MGRRENATTAISPRAQAEHHQAVAMLAYDANMLGAADGSPQLMSWEEAHQLWHELHEAGLLADRPDEAATAPHCGQHDNPVGELTQRQVP